MSNLLVDGFFPRTAVTDRPARRRISGFQEIGLPFESDTAITRHLAAFLAAHGETPNESVRPTHVLFNGGVFKAEILRGRLLEVIGDWFPEHDRPRPLSGAPDLDHAVAKGAAYYGWAKQRGGMRIRGGTARSYYVGIETAGLAVPGAPRPLRALCVVPIGMEEGTETDVPSDEIGLVVGEPAQFRFFSSPVRKQDRPGDVLDRWNEEELAETDSMETTLPADQAIEEDYVPVRFHSRSDRTGHAGALVRQHEEPTAAGNWSSACGTRRRRRARFEEQLGQRERWVERPQTQQRAWIPDFSHPCRPLLWRNSCALKHKFFRDALVVLASSRRCASRLISISWRYSSKAT